MNQSNAASPLKTCNVPSTSSASPAINAVSASANNKKSAASTPAMASQTSVSEATNEINPASTNILAKQNNILAGSGVMSQSTFSNPIPIPQQLYSNVVSNMTSASRLTKGSPNDSISGGQHSRITTFPDPSMRTYNQPITQTINSQMPLSNTSMDFGYSQSPGASHSLQFDNQHLLKRQRTMEPLKHSSDNTPNAFGNLTGMNGVTFNHSDLNGLASNNWMNEIQGNAQNAQVSHIITILGIVRLICFSLI